MVDIQPQLYVSHQFLESRALIPMVGAYEVSDM
jgi:hypothetical protein